ncbi:MAG TPA: DNA repair protein RadA [Bacteroidaceae bacterium]|nr:DNA repair protein RadA [Bacteroidaceae bacterium]
MAKGNKTVFVCSNCGYDSPKWSGKCPVCDSWNSFTEHVNRKTTLSGSEFKSLNGIDASCAIRLNEVSGYEDARIDLCEAELNRVLGGGLVKGSLVLLGGEPGIGKSTLILQTVVQLTGIRVLYVSGEESARQIKLRAERLSTNNPELITKNENLFILCETSIENILEHIKECKPELIIIDSIQTMSTEMADSSAGSITQVRECASLLLKFSKRSGIPIILIGHITKEGSIAGPKILEHIVDTVIQFEGDQHYHYRILRPIKNRFGSTSELGIYEMRQNGLKQVNNPSELLLSEIHKEMSGVAIASVIEGARPFLIETQALVSTAVYGTPQRSAIGFDYRRLNMLLAILEKRAGFKLGQKDVFLNVTGGLRMSDPAIDLSVISAILSSNLDIVINRSLCMAGEIGLSGEVRPISRIEQRIEEAKKIGFKQIIIPKSNLNSLGKNIPGIEIIPVGKVEEAFRQIFG